MMRGFLLSLLLVVGGAHATNVALHWSPQGPAAASGEVAITYNAYDTDEAAASVTRSITGISIGTASADRIVVIVIGTKRNTGAPNITSATIGGGSATIVEDGTGCGSTYVMCAGIIMAEIASGTTANVSATWDYAVEDTIFYSYSVTGAETTEYASASALGNNDGSVDVSVNTANNGGVIGVSAYLLDSKDNNWTGVTEDAGGKIQVAGSGMSAGHAEGLSAETPRTVTTAWVGDAKDTAAASISFEPN